MKTIAPFALVLLLSSAAASQERPTAAVLETQAGEGVEAGTGGAVDRMVRARLDGLNVVRTSSGVALDLEEVQLALGCVGETAECLGPVASELSVQLLLIPAIDQTDGDIMLTITLFDREAGTLRRVVRQGSGENARAELLDAVDGQLRELFGLPAVPPDEANGGEGPEGPSTPGATTPDELDVGAFVLLAAGGVVLAGGIGTGVSFLEEESAFARLGHGTEEENDALRAAYSRMETFAIVTDVLLPVGGAIAIAGLVWLLVDVTDNGTGQAARLTPLIGPSFAGLAVDGRWGSQ